MGVAYPTVFHMNRLFMMISDVQEKTAKKTSLFYFERGFRKTGISKEILCL